MIIVQIIMDHACTNRMQYVLDFINHHPTCAGKIKFGLSSDEATHTIYYGHREHATADYIVRPQNIFFDTDERFNKKQTKQLYANSYVMDDQNLYSVETDDSVVKNFIASRVISFDVLETIFFHISRIEETWIKQSDYLTDKWQFEKQLLLVQNGLEKTAVVDDIVRALCTLITAEKPIRSDYKILTHDIDHIQLFNRKTDILKKTAGIIYRAKGLKAIKVLYAKYSDYISSAKDPYDTFEWMLDSDQDHKRIYFLVGGNHRWDSVYDLAHPSFKRAISLALEKGYEIGIHPSYESWDNPEYVKREKSKLEDHIQQRVSISRQHFLNFDIEQTPDILLSAGITTDSSLGYTRYTGYRCGTAFPYLLYDFKNERASLLREEPLVFMDMAWFYEAERTGSWDISLDKFNGSFNFHNSFFFLAEQQGIQMKEAYLATFGS